MKGFLQLLNSWGFNGGTATLIGLLILGYIKIAMNHYKHVINSIEKFDKKLNEVEKRLIHLEALQEKK